MSKKVIIAPESKTKSFVEIAEGVAPEPQSGDDARQQLLIKRSEDRKKFVTVPDQIAKSTLYFRNYKYQKAEQYFPQLIKSHFRFVDKCYPHAEGGMLLVDEPKNETQFAHAKEKQQTLRKAGFRHIIVWAQREDGQLGEKEPHEIFFDCHKQLEEGEKIYVAFGKAGPKN